MTEAEYQSLKEGSKVEFGQHPWITQAVIKSVTQGTVYLDINGGESRYYPAYVQNSGRLVEDWTPKPVVKDEMEGITCEPGQHGLT